MGLIVATLAGVSMYSLLCSWASQERKSPQDRQVFSDPRETMATTVLCLAKLETIPKLPQSELPRELLRKTFRFLAPTGFEAAKRYKISPDSTALINSRLGVSERDVIECLKAKDHVTFIVHDDSPNSKVVMVTRSGFDHLKASGPGRWQFLFIACGRNELLSMYRVDHRGRAEKGVGFGFWPGANISDESPAWYLDRCNQDPYKFKGIRGLEDDPEAVVIMTDKYLHVQGLPSGQ